MSKTSGRVSAASTASLSSRSTIVPIALVCQTKGLGFFGLALSASASASRIEMVWPSVAPRLRASAFASSSTEASISTVVRIHLMIGAGASDVKRLTAEPSAAEVGELIHIQDPPESLVVLKVDQRSHSLRRPPKCGLGGGGRVELCQRKSEQHRER